jgi:hypothetical protein
MANVQHVRADEVLPGDRFHMTSVGRTVRVVGAAHTGPAGERWVTLHTDHGERRYPAGWLFVVVRD